MSKRLVTLAFFFLLSALLTACGTQVEAIDEKFQTQGVEVRVYKDYDHVYLDQGVKCKLGSGIQVHGVLKVDVLFDGLWYYIEPQEENVKRDCNGGGWVRSAFLNSP